MTPGLSVAILAGNDQQSIGACIDSVLASAEAAHENVEIVVALSQSTDHTRLIAEAKGARCPLQQEGVGAAAALNLAVRSASSPAIATLGAGSLMASAMVARIIDYVYDGAYSGGRISVRPARPLPGSVVQRFFASTRGVFGPASSPAYWFPRESFEAAGGFGAADDFASRLKALAKSRAKKYAVLRGVVSITGQRPGLPAARPVRFGRSGQALFEPRLTGDES